jgi:hypothetical protein
MSKIRPAMPALLMMLMFAVAGCSETQDERLTELARESLQQQAMQNQRLGEQSRQIAEAAERLVESDAEARRELLAMHAALQQELESQQTRIDTERAGLECERRAIASQRGRDPIIAQTIGVVGTVVACLLPLLLAGYVLYTVNRDVDNDRHLAQFLLEELTAGRPRLLLPLATPPAAIRHRPVLDDPPSDGKRVDAGDE